MAIEKIYSDGISHEELRTRLRDLTRDTKANHGIYDMRYPAWGLGLLGFEPVAESGNAIARVLMTVPPGDEAPKNGDTMVIPQKNGQLAIAMIFDADKCAGDWIGDAYNVHAVQFNPKMAIGHDFTEKGKEDSRGL